jgi:hypothetical protein
VFGFVEESISTTEEFIYPIALLLGANFEIKEKLLQSLRGLIL